ncbi:MAG: Rieske 2Fe-2S domain-containing protein [Bacteroidia bacterium]|nr:Rieske 2Fe-2S domain-containing protein [Bacteroidia bacterium]
MNPFTVDPDIRTAKTLDTSFYTNPVYFELAREAIFAIAWQWAGDTEWIKEGKNIQPFTFLPGYMNEPLVLTQDAGGIHCLSNVCTHRGNLIATETCKAKSLICKYHGRRFSLSGSFMSMPQFHNTLNFPSADDSLTKVPLMQWGNFLFTKLISEGKKNIEFPREIIEKMHWYPMEKLRYYPELNRIYTVKAHWALYCENYLEGFHIPFVHSELNEVLNFSEYTTELFPFGSLQTGIANEGELSFILPPESDDYAKNKKIAAYYFWVFPNMMFNFYPWGISVNIIYPEKPDLTRVSFITYVLDESKMNQGAGNELHTVEMEDEAIVENVQKGVHSRFYRYGRYSPDKEQGTHHFHRLIAEFMQ